MYFQKIIVYKIPPGGGGGSIASSRPNTLIVAFQLPTYQQFFCTAFIILFGCLVARGIREISVGVFQFDMGNIGR